MKPRVFIAMASTILGGPGKGLVQFFKNGGLEFCHPLCITYVIGHNGKTEFTHAIEKRGSQGCSFTPKAHFRSVLDQSILADRAQ